MDTHGAEPVSWLDLPDPAPATPATEAIFARARSSQGYVRGQLRIAAHKPAILEALVALGTAVMRDKAGSLSGAERELIALVVSVENRCDPCVFGHAAALRGFGWTSERVAVVEVNYRRAGLSERERALSDYAIKLTRTPAEIEPADLQALRDAGIDEPGILEAAAITGYFNLSNRLNSGVGVRASPEAYAAYR